jgi:hypothetical protein
MRWRGSAVSHAAHKHVVPDGMGPAKNQHERVRVIRAGKKNHGKAKKHTAKKALGPVHPDLEANSGAISRLGELLLQKLEHSVHLGLVRIVTDRVLLRVDADTGRGHGRSAHRLCKGPTHQMKSRIMERKKIRVETLLSP